MKKIIHFTQFNFDVQISDEGAEPFLEFITINSDKADRLIGHLAAYKRVVETDSSRKTHFKLERDDPQSKGFIVKGNIVNAINGLEFTKQVDSSFKEELARDGEIASFLTKNSTFEFPEFIPQIFSGDSDQSRPLNGLITLMHYVQLFGAEKSAQIFFEEGVLEPTESERLTARFQREQQTEQLNVKVRT